MRPEETDVLGPYSPDKTDFTALLECIDDADQALRERMQTQEQEAERVVLVGMKSRDNR